MIPAKIGALTDDTVWVTCLVEKKEGIWPFRKTVWDIELFVQDGDPCDPRPNGAWVNHRTGKRVPALSDECRILFNAWHSGKQGLL